MKSFLKENPTIAFGLGLPLLLTLIFSIASLVPTLLVDPPQYDIVYATGYYDDWRDFQVTVSDNKARVTYVTGVGNYRIPRLWYYSAKTGTVKEIALVLPANVVTPRHRKKKKQQDENREQRELIVPELEKLVFNKSSIAPDGYAFDTKVGRYSRGLLDSLFYSSRHRYQATLKKDGRTVRLPNTDNRYYYRNIRLIGWVIP